ncbi:hypothetical protein E2P81_ATG00542 [Venturia nashicola]|nr:hypothetical protein E2P81_ATG00542 [Venturia nashicola]
MSGMGEHEASEYIAIPKSGSQNIETLSKYTSRAGRMSNSRERRERVAEKEKARQARKVDMKMRDWAEVCPLPELRSRTVVRLQDLYSLITTCGNRFSFGLSSISSARTASPAIVSFAKTKSKLGRAFHEFLKAVDLQIARSSSISYLILVSHTKMS